jgi:glucosamine-6-phosphate deaminase
MRKLSSIAPDWWDYTTLDDEIIRDAARLTVKDLEQLSRPGFTINFFDTRESFYLSEALEYIKAWQQATESEPAGICGPIGPTEQLPLVAQLVNEFGINLKNAHFWGMDEWVVNGREVAYDHPLGFARTDMELCFNRISNKLAMPAENIHFPKVSTVDEYSNYFDKVRCLVMQGGQGEVKHWAFNDPLKREGIYKDNPPPAEEFTKLRTRIVDLHPVTLIQNARTSGKGNIRAVPQQAITVGPVETWKAEKVSIWHYGTHDNPFGMRLTAFMISKKIADSSVPMSLLADHPNVQFNYYTPGIGTCAIEMH